MISGGEIWGPGSSILIEILFVFNKSVFAFCIVFEWITKWDAFAGKWKSEYLQGRRAKVEILMNYMMDPESEIVHISKDLQQKRWLPKAAHGGGGILNF